MENVCFTPKPDGNSGHSFRRDVPKAIISNDAMLRITAITKALPCFHFNENQAEGYWYEATRVHLASRRPAVAWPLTARAQQPAMLVQP
jgi:hypothetical protein